MGYRFKIIKRNFENDALVIFIDLLGTSKLWGSNVSTEKQAEITLSGLLGKFDIKFSDHFQKDERKDSFDISIFADSIVISQRKKVIDIVERLVNFSRSYQIDLLLNNNILSRTTIIRGGFFSFKMKEPSEDSILGSHYTSVSLCGGGGIISTHNRQKGLPVGVYVDNGTINELSLDQKKMAIPVKKDKELYLIKNDIDIMNLLPDNTLELLCNNPKASKKAIIQSLEASNYDEDAIRKFMPWMLVHMRKYKYV